MGLNTILKANIEGTEQELYPKVYGDNVYLDDKTTLTPKIAEMVEAINAKAKDTDVMDIKIKYDGSTANTPGDAVREQISELKSDLDNKLDSYINIEFTDDGKYIDNNGIEYETTGTAITPFIEVLGSKLSYNLYQNKTGSIGLIAFYDANKQLLSVFTDNIGSSHIAIGEINIPLEAKYYRATKWYRQDETPEVRYLKEYIETSAIVKNIHYESNTSKWYGKTIACYGDSITWYDGKQFGSDHTESGLTAFGYESWLRKLLGANVINRGRDGAKMPQLLESIRSHNFSSIDCVTITAGANDFRISTEEVGQLQPIGSTFDETTYIGAFQSAIEYILNVKPTCTIVLITPIKGYTYKNSTLSLMPESYPNAIKQIADLYSLPICDWYYHSGVNELTISTYIGDVESNPYRLHPNNAGYERMGRMIASVLNSI